MKLAPTNQTTPAPAPALASFTPSEACARAGFVSGDSGVVSAIDSHSGLSIPQIGVNVAQTRSGVDRDALADLFDAAAWIIRGGMQHG